MTDLNIALLFAISITALTTIAIFMAGFSTGNRFAMLGPMRAVAQLYVMKFQLFYQQWELYY